MPSPSNVDVVAVDVSLRPHELLAAWRPAPRLLVLPIGQLVPKRRRIQARLDVAGLGAAATITGRVAAARRRADGFELELAPDDTRLEALERLVAVAAAGAPVRYAPRAPRLLAALPAVVYGLGGPTYMTTFAVSANGCGLAWSGPMPDVGTPMELRLGAGREAASFCAEVCWTKPSGRAPTVGVQFAAGERHAWARLLAGLGRAGAPPG